MRTLDEAIAHAREVASEQRRRSGTCTTNDNECDKFSNCMKCAEEHEQLAEWLEELKAYRENSNGYNKEDIELNRKAMYNKAIDDFVKSLQKLIEKELSNPMLMLDCKKCGIWKNYNIEHIAEQLKAGELNE